MKYALIILLLILSNCGMGETIEILPATSCSNYSKHLFKLCLNEDVCTSAARKIFSEEEDLKKYLYHTCINDDYTETQIRCILRSKTMPELLKKDCLGL